MPILNEVIQITFTLQDILISGIVSFILGMILGFFLGKKLEIVTTFLWISSILWLAMVIGSFIFGKDIPYLFNIIGGMLLMNAVGVTTERSLEIFNIINTFKGGKK